MPNSLGSLVVRLGLDAAEYVSGLTRSEYQAKKFAASIEGGIKTSINLATIALAGMATAAAASLAAVDQLAKQAGNFQDLAEKTGANAEALASFSVAAQVAGSNIEEVANFSIKLSKNLAGVDDESKAAGAALTALGIPIKEFKQLKPEEQIERLAKALAGFNDIGGGKAAALEAIAKGGAQLLPFLKELEQQGGRQVILTQQQIQLADEYADKQARSRAELNLYAQVAATKALPAITNLTGAAKDFIAELIGIDKNSKSLRDSNVITDWANNAVQALGFVISAGQGLGRVFQVVGETIAAGAAQTAAIARGDLKGAIAIGRDWQNQVDQILQKQLFSTQLSRRIKEQQDTNARRSIEDRGFTPPGRALVFGGAEKDVKSLRERQSEAERYLETLIRQAEAMAELTTVKKLIADIQKGRLKGLNEGLSAQLFSIAEQIDAEKELEKWVRASAKAFDEEVRATKHAADERARATDKALDEAEHIKVANEALRDEIAIILGGETARAALEKARVADAIAIKEEALAQAQLDPLRQAEADAIKSQIELLRERAGLLQGRSIAEQMKKDAQSLQEVKNLFSDSFANAFTDFVTGTKSAKDAFRSFTDDLTRQISRIAAQNLSNALFGGNNSAGPDFFGVLAKLAGSFFGGGASGGGVGGIGGFSGGGFGEHFANGTRYAPGGLAMVGEHGPEIRYIPRGAQVLPNRGGGNWGFGGGGVERPISINQSFYGPTTSASARQVRAAARDGVIEGIRDR